MQNYAVLKKTLSQFSRRDLKRYVQISNAILNRDEERARRIVRKALKPNKIFRLDIGCGDNKQKGFYGMDVRNTKNVDVQWSAEDFPYPFPNDSCDVVLMSHLIEHLNPQLIWQLMDELWRIIKVTGQLWLAMPYAGSVGEKQDPSHIRSWNEVTATYFDPVHFLYQIDKPKPWKIITNSWLQAGNLDIVLEKRPLDHGIKLQGGYDQHPEGKK